MAGHAQDLGVGLAVVLALLQHGDVVEVEALGVDPGVCIGGEASALGAETCCCCPLAQAAGLQGTATQAAVGVVEPSDGHVLGWPGTSEGCAGYLREMLPCYLDSLYEGPVTAFHAPACTLFRLGQEAYEMVFSKTVADANNPVAG